MGIFISTIGDLYVYWWDDFELFAYVQVAKAILFGGLYVVFGAALLKHKTQYGTLATIAGIFGIFTGVGFLTVILAMSALVSLTIFEITLLVMLYQAAEGPANVKNQPQEASLQLGL